MSELFIRGLNILWEQVEPDSYLHTVEAVRNTDHLTFQAPITFFVGENGTGKSTLLEAMAVACGFNPEGGTVNYRFATRDSHSNLYEAVRMIRGVAKPTWGYFLRAESFYNVASAEEEYTKGFAPSQRFHEHSHGESFLMIANHHLQGGGLYFLDEPEAALSTQRQLSLLYDIYVAAQEGAQFFIATHSPVLTAAPNSEILSFADGNIHPVAYEETENYQLMKLFINHRERVLDNLFSKE